MNMDVNVEILAQNRSREAANFKLVSNFAPNGDQPEAIQSLLKGIKENER